MGFDIHEHSHRRLNPLTGEWIQVSPHRSKRPWQGQVEKVQTAEPIPYDQGCYLCPGNKRSNGDVNPNYLLPFSFVNDFAAIVEDVPDGSYEVNELLVAKKEKGICKVICFSPRHDLTLPELGISEITDVICTWMREYRQLGTLPYVNYVQIFENKGSVMGCSNPHPHGQIWAQESIPMEPMKKHLRQEAYFSKHRKTLLSDYLITEIKLNERIVFENDNFLVLVPFWATWPFETMIVPKRAMQDITQMTEPEVADFAEALKILTVKYDNLFEVSFPYSSGIHQAPTDGARHDGWHWHMVFYPPLLRSATVKKFMVGYEMLANPQRDITAEFAAEKLKSMGTVHFRQRKTATAENDIAGTGKVFL